MTMRLLHWILENLRCVVVDGDWVREDAHIEHRRARKVAKTIMSGSAEEENTTGASPF